MKKFVTVLLVAILAIGCVFALAACKKDEPKVDETKILKNDAGVYVIAGAVQGWGLEGKDPNGDAYATRRLTAICIGDERVASIKSKLMDAKYLYVIEDSFDYNDLLEYADDSTAAASHSKAGWVNNVDGVGPTLLDPKDGKGARYFDGNAAVKIILVAQIDGVWADNWYPSKETGAPVKSLTPDTLYVPTWGENPAYENSGTWANNPTLLGEAGRYLIVFAEFNDGNYGLGAIRLGDLTPAA